MGFTKLWLKEDKSWELNIHGDRQVGRGGGLALLVRNEIQS